MVEANDILRELFVPVAHLSSKMDSCVQAF